VATLASISRVDIARHRQVEQQHRLVPAVAQGGGDMLPQDHRLACGRGGKHHVGFAQVTLQLGQGQRHATVAGGQVLGMGEGAVGDQQALHPRIAQMFGDQLDGLAGTYQQNGGVFQAGKRVLGNPHRRGGDRDRVGAHAGIGSRPFGDREGLLEQAVELLADNPAVMRQRPGILHLAQDLRFAQHHRIQPGGDPEQMPDSLTVGMLVQVAIKRAGMVFQPAGQCRAILGDRVQLGAVAGGQQHGFSQLR